jgi:hypothetical protein
VSHRPEKRAWIKVGSVHSETQDERHGNMENLENVEIDVDPYVDVKLPMRPIKSGSIYFQLDFFRQVALSQIS